MALVDTDLVARYYIDEAASGQTPTELDDSASNPVNLSITYDGANPAFSSVATGRGLSWASNASNGRAMVALGSNKIYTAINGAQKLTIEMVVDVTTFNTSDGFLLQIGLDGDYSPFSIFDSGSGSLGVYHGTTYVTFTEDLEGAGRVVIHIVVDTTQATPSDRIKLYVNGTAENATGGTQPAQNASLSPVSGDYFVVGNRSNGGRGIAGKIYYCALYDNAMSSADISTNYTDLSADDDEVVNNPPNTPTITATPSGSQVNLSSSAFSDPDSGDTHASSRWRIYRIV